MKLQGLLVSVSMGLLTLTGCANLHQPTVNDTATAVVYEDNANESEYVVVEYQTPAIYEAAEQYNQVLDSYRLSPKPDGYKRYFYNKYTVFAEQTSPTPDGYEDVDMNVISKASAEHIEHHEKYKEELARQAELRAAEEAKAKAEYAEINGLRVQ